MHLYLPSSKRLQLLRIQSAQGILGIIICLLAPFTLISCDSPQSDPIINFVGDSIVARWDINQDFPSYCVYNHGVGGSGIELLENYSHKFLGQDVVVIAGTNDNNLLIEDQRDDYAKRYLSSVLSLTDHNIYLYSLLPRDFTGDRTNINDDIQAFNAIIRNFVEDIDRVVYIDVFSDFINGGNIDYTYYSDGLHLNSIGYEILTQKLLKEL